MTIDRKTTSYRSFAWTIVLVIVLASFVLITLVTNSKSNTIKKNIQLLQNGNDNYRRLDSCISVLYVAENNSRLYAVTADSGYLHKYTRQMETVSSILAEFQEEKKKQAVFSNLFLPELLMNKQIKNDRFIQMRKMVDSLLVFHMPDKVPDAALTDLKPYAVKTVRKIAKTDSMIIEPKKRNKKFWRRLVEAVSNKSADSSDIQTKAIQTTTTIEDSLALMQSRSNFAQIDNRQKLNIARSRLSKAELELLTVNNRIFSNLQSALKVLRNEEVTNIERLRMSLLLQTSDKLTELNKLSWGNIAVVLILLVMIILNISRLYRSEKTVVNYSNQVVELARKKAEFLTHVSHEIRTPLNSIIGFSGQIEEDKLDEDLRQKVNSIKNSSDILLMLVNEILDFSKFESGKIKLNNHHFRPQVILDNVFDMLSVLAVNKAVRLTKHFELPPDLTLNGDDFRLKQVVLNLLTNAIKFTPDGGSVSIYAAYESVNEESTGMLKMVFTDSGIGIAQENLTKIFEDFTQIETPSDIPRQTGTGLGLPITKKIIDLFNGHIDVTSEIGEGTVFTVGIPMASVLSDPFVSEKASTDISNILKDKRVLMVDDIKINLLLLSRIMDKNGVEYDLASDGEEALRLFKSTDYDLIITDVQMPKMDGLELTKCVRSEADNLKSDIPVIGYTGSVSMEERSKYLDNGMNGLLDKPFTENDLVEVLGRVIL